ncbi:hypothetical protein STEG23_026103 [Scotinomys teguina]
MEQEMLERLKAEELLFQQQLAFQLELEMQENEKQKTEELQRTQGLNKEMGMESTARGEESILSEESVMDSGKTLAEISDRYGAPNLSRVEELDEPMLSDLSTFSILSTLRTVRKGNFECHHYKNVVKIQATDSNKDPSCSRIRDQDMTTTSSSLGLGVTMALSGSTDLSDGHGSSSNVVPDRRQSHSQSSVVTGATDINTDPGCSRTLDPDTALGFSSVWDISMAPVVMRTTQIGMVPVVA